MATVRRTLMETPAPWRLASVVLGLAVFAALLTGGPVLADDTKRHLVMVLAESEYHAARTLPLFAEEELKGEYEISIITSDSRESIEGLEKLKDADVALFYIHRRTFPPEQLGLIRDYLEAGKPLVALRTSSHAFENWKTFDREVLGCHYGRHYSNKSEDNPTIVQVVEQNAGHRIVQGLPREEFPVASWLYKSRPLAWSAQCLLMGRLKDDTTEPVAWTHLYRGGRIFYTMLGHEKDFEIPAFRQLLKNGIAWAAGETRLTEKTPTKPGPLPDTGLLEFEGDIASELVSGVDRFLDEQLAKVSEERSARWQRSLSSPDEREAFIQTKRQRLAKILGITDPLPPWGGFEFMETTRKPSIVKETPTYRVHAVRWPAVRGVHGEGLLLEPKAGAVKAGVVVVPDVRQTPEDLAGLNDATPPRDRIAARLAEAGVRVVIPVIIDEQSDYALSWDYKPLVLTHREFCYRPSFELGRHLVGYEVQKIQSAALGLKAEAEGAKVGLMGLGVGGRLCLYAAALTPAIDVVKVGGAFGGWDDSWNRPIDGNIFGLLTDFGDPQLAAMIAPRTLIVDSASSSGPAEIAAGGRGAPAKRTDRPFTDAVAESVEQARNLLGGSAASLTVSQEAPSSGDANHGLAAFRHDPCRDFGLALGVDVPIIESEDAKTSPPSAPVKGNPRQKRQIEQILQDTQLLLEESPYTREGFWEKTRSARRNHNVDEWQEATRNYREYFRREVIGHFDLPKLPTNPRTRQIFDEPAYKGYEVVLDVFPNVIAYGILLVPKGIGDGERRPVVVCQHGLEGRPRDLADPTVNNPAYNQFGCRLAERGFVVFAPQNLYIFTDRFRLLQRKLNPMGKTLFSIIVPQHEQILDWLETLPFVDGHRMGFFGLSYGGKSAMRIPALVEKYALSICSADFNDWVWKNASTRSPYSYVWTGEYEIFEWDLGSTFNYAEMAALICPRPFMVERGHRDGVAPDERVALEYAKIRLLYADLKIPERTEIEFFDGPHTIHGVGTFQFLHRHFFWPSHQEPKPLNQ